MRTSFSHGCTQLGESLVTIPNDFTLHDGIKRVYKQRADSIRAGANIDWATAEALAFGSLCLEGNRYRQDDDHGLPPWCVLWMVADSHSAYIFVTVFQCCVVLCLCTEYGYPAKTWSGEHFPIAMRCLLTRSPTRGTAHWTTLGRQPLLSPAPTHICQRCAVGCALAMPVAVLHFSLGFGAVESSRQYFPFLLLLSCRAVSFLRCMDTVRGVRI